LGKDRFPLGHRVGVKRPYPNENPVRAELVRFYGSFRGRISMTLVEPPVLSAVGTPWIPPQKSTPWIILFRLKLRKFDE
jgi:hypothetical protein